MKTIEQYFPVVLFIMLYKVALNFESVDKIYKCDHSNESRAEHSLGTTVTRWLERLSVELNPEVLRFK